MSGGSDAIRGFYLQTWISIFEMVKDTKWTSIEMEPKQDKIDILVNFENKNIKVIQVKSSINNFHKSKIKEVLESLIDANPNAVYYQVVLIGETNADLESLINDVCYQKIIDKSVKNINIKVIPLNIEKIEEDVKTQLQEYMDYLGYDMKADALSLINKSLVSDSLIHSIKKDKYYRENFDDNLILLSELIYSANQDNNMPVSINISEKGIRHYKKIKFIKRIAIALAIFLCINPFIKLYIEGLTYLDTMCSIGLVCILLGVVLFFKRSDNKFRECEEDEIEEYLKNDGCAENNILRINVMNRTEYENNKKQVYSRIYIENKTKEKIEYIEGKIQFKHSNEVLYEHPFNRSDIDALERIIIFNGRVTPQKSKKYWTCFKVKIKEIRTCGINLNDLEIYSESTYRLYGTLLNSYYLPVIDELFHYESTEAVRVIKEMCFGIHYLIKYLNLKRFFILLICGLIGLTIVVCSFIGIYNFLYLPIKLICLLFN